MLFHSVLLKFISLYFYFIFLKHHFPNIINNSIIKKIIALLHFPIYQMDYDPKNKKNVN